MTRKLAVVTPTFGPDFELCRDLHRSVLEFTPEDTVQYLITSRSDVEQFSRFRGPRCAVISYRELLPRRMVEVAWANTVLRNVLRMRASARIAAVNLRHPVPPIRGWAMQQVVKLAAATEIDADVILLADSDVQLVRPVTAETFLSDGKVRLYRRDGEVDQGLPRHLAWHGVARELLGLPLLRPPLPDYVSAFGAWDRQVVLALQERIELVTGKSWIDAVAGRFNISEWTLYGVFVDEVLGAQDQAPHTGSNLCHSYWETSPLDAGGADMFVDRLGADDVAILIQSKSETPIEVRRQALARFSGARGRTERG